MTELRELYQQIILDHNKNPRNFGKLPEANRMQEATIPCAATTCTSISTWPTSGLPTSA